MMHGVAETAKILGVSPNLCRGLVKAGAIKSVMVGNRHKISDEFIADYLKKNVYVPERVFTERKRGRKPKG